MPQKASCFLLKILSDMNCLKVKLKVVTISGVSEQGNHCTSHAMTLIALQWRLKIHVMTSTFTQS